MEKGKQSGSANQACHLPPERERLVQKINLQLAVLGQPTCNIEAQDDYLQVAGDMVRKLQQNRRLLSEYRCPADRRIEVFVTGYLRNAGVDYRFSLPTQNFLLQQAGLARELSLPACGNTFVSDYISSYRVQQGVLHNPVKDRRTTQGVFHVVENGLPIPSGKKAVPALAFSRLLEAALNPPDSLLNLPFTDEQEAKAKTWISLLLRPTVSPEVEGLSPRMSMETRFFVPGGLVANLDFVERIFGNAGDPNLPENDAALDVDGWTGHTGGVMLAPHLTQLTKKALGLPHYDQASERQRTDGMCWKDPDELYNDGQAFKVVCRDMSGVVFTLIADNYFGYSKKEIKSQISYAANLLGGNEEEHAGGALVFPAYNLGDLFRPDSRVGSEGHSFAEVSGMFRDLMTLQPEGYGVDKHYPNIFYVPEDTLIDLQGQSVSWSRGDQNVSIKLRPGHTYVHPCGYKVRMEKHPHSPSWRLIGTDSVGTYCHKPCTVSGGGKSEISKSISGSVLSGPFYVADLEADLDQVEEIFRKDYSGRFREAPPPGWKSRSFLSEKRSLGSVIRLLMPSEEDYSPEYNAWLESIPQHIRALAFVIKRFYHQEWEGDWRSHFSVDIVNGYPGHELKYEGRTLVASYLRVAKTRCGEWRIYKVRQDFVGADKVQMEDDISASITLPAESMGLRNTSGTSVKLVENCESRLFQRPDDAVHRGLDAQAEADLAEPDNFISNFQPLDREDALSLVDDAIDFMGYTEPMQALIQEATQADEDAWFVSSAHPRLVNGRPSPNMRYLQRRPDLKNPRDRYVAEIGLRLFHRIPLSRPLYLPVDATLPGRRNNPIDRARKIRPLAVYNPIHYQELPELFMDYISSLTGKSPSTTGAGSEGALTKGPFNSLAPTADLNNALVSMILCGHQGFSSAAGHIGSEIHVEHDISMLVPEIWCRIPPEQRRAEYMIEHGYLERVADFEHAGMTVRASRLGYRITGQFVRAFLGKIFDNPNVVFDEAILKPETQDREAFIDGVNNIVEAQSRVAAAYLADGSVEDACPPLKALLYIMANGQYQGLDIESPGFRRLFSPEYLLASDWYRERLEIKQGREVDLWERHAAYIESRSEEGEATTGVAPASLQEKGLRVEQELQRRRDPAYLQSLQGSLGADWIHRSSS